MSDPCQLTATELVAAYRARRLSPVDAVDAILDRIARINPRINAYFYIDESGARTAARASAERWSRGEPSGPLDGVPYSVKDHVLTEGMPSPWGVGGGEPWPPGTVDAPIVARLRESGAVLLGKTAQPELAMFCGGLNGAYPLARNPWDLSKTPGGSSAGAAAALAAGLGPLAIGSDAGGSIRIPAGYCGVVGHKPTFGRIPFFPPFGPGVTYGPMARSVADVALALNVVTRPDWRDIWALPPDDHDHLDDLGRDVRGLRIAYCDQFGYGVPISPGVKSRVAEALAVLEGLGATIVPVGPFFDYDPYDAISDATFPGLRMLVATVVGDRIDRLSPLVRGIMARTDGATLEKFFVAKGHETQLSLRIASVLHEYDALVTPTLPTTAFDAERAFPEGVALNAYGYTMAFNPYTWPFNVTLQPAISVPCGLSDDGLPVGLQVVGPRGGDGLCLRVAHAYERSRPALPACPI